MPGVTSVLVLGEALLDVIDGRRLPGGSPMNVSVGLARLGVPTVFHTTIGHDDGGEILARHLLASGVTLTPGSWGSGPTFVAEVRLDDAGTVATVSTSPGSRNPSSSRRGRTGRCRSDRSAR
ncbi:PfkB family carbohydrate kinase [Dactylosporangium sp. NPDC050688]|uniref:PfkB family carbohydrate kinase n=1 Tax=Dactylosporangium sp. NPDC050688 TaxID=3157217 RepID=UPI0033E4949A